MVNVMEILEIDVKYLKIIKVIYNKLIANIILNGNIVFTLKSEMRQRWPTSPFLFNIVLRVLATVRRQEKDTEGIQIQKEEAKLSLSSENTILYLKEPIEPRKFLGLTNNFSKVAG